MTVKARIDVDVVFHDATDSTMTVGSLSEHLLQTPSSAVAVSGTCGTSAVSIAGSGSLSTLAVKNTGSTPLRIAGAVDVPAGRMAVVPTTATITVQGVGGNGAYSCIWVG
jgi:hypothetical protein